MVRAWQNNTFILVRGCRCRTTECRPLIRWLTQLEDYLSLKDRLQHSFSRQAVAFEYCRNTSMLGAFAEGSYAEWHDLEIPNGQGKRKAPQMSQLASTTSDDTEAMQVP